MIARIVAVVLLVVGSASPFVSPARAQTLPTIHRLPAALALEAVGEAIRTCLEQGNRVTATVVDIDGVPIATLRADGAGVHTLETSRAKAVAAVSLAGPALNLNSTGELAERFPPQIGFQAPAGMLFRPGGVVIRLGDEIIGAIGVGGSPKSEICAFAGVEKIRDRLK